MFETIQTCRVLIADAKCISTNQLTLSFETGFGVAEPPVSRGWGQVDVVLFFWLGRSQYNVGLKKSRQCHTYAGADSWTNRVYTKSWLSSRVGQTRAPRNGNILC